MTEISHFGFLLAVIAGGLAVAVVSTRLSDRLPIPAPALFLVTAAVVSDLWPAIGEHLDVRTVERVGVVALVIILLNGGMDIGWSRLRGSLAPVLLLGILGTFVTAAAVAAVAHVGLGFDWRVAGLLGAALAPTDPAVMFSVLGGREIEGRSGTTLEGEAGFNDPAGIALMIGMIELATHEDASFLVVLQEFALEMTIGAAIGFAGAMVMVSLVRRLQLSSENLYPVLIGLAAILLYGLTSLAHGSGFLAVFIAGLRLAELRGSRQAEVKAFHGSLAGLAEIVVFVALGLTITLSEIPGRAWLEGGVLVLTLALIARPVAVGLTLWPSSFSRAERLFITWSGLKGAVPILLAAFAVLQHAPQSDRVYVIVFVVVLLSVAIQGSLIPTVARLLRIPMR